MSTYQRFVEFRDETCRPTGRTILQDMPGGGTATSKEIQRVVQFYKGAVLLTIDVDAILNTLGHAALTNQGGKARALNGLIVCKRVGQPVIREEALPVRRLTSAERYQ